MDLPPQHEKRLTVVSGEFIDDYDASFASTDGLESC